MDVCPQVVQNRGFQYNNFGSYEQASSRNLRTPSMYPVSNNQPQVPPIRRMYLILIARTQINIAIDYAHICRYYYSKFLRCLSMLITSCRYFTYLVISLLFFHVSSPREETACSISIQQIHQVRLQ